MFLSNFIISYLSDLFFYRFLFPLTIMKIRGLSNIVLTVSKTLNPCSFLYESYQTSIYKRVNGWFKLPRLGLFRPSLHISQSFFCKIHKYNGSSLL